MDTDTIRWNWEPDALSGAPRQLRLRLTDGRWTNFILPYGEDPGRDDLGDDYWDVFDLNTPNVLRDLRIQFFGSVGERVGEVASASDAGAYSEPDFAFDLMNPDDYGKRRRRIRLPRVTRPTPGTVRVMFIVGSLLLIAGVAFGLGHSMLQQTGDIHITVPTIEPGSPLSGPSTPAPSVAPTP